LIASTPEDTYDAVNAAGIGRIAEALEDSRTSEILDK
jgi:hypothetical protein